MGIESRIGILHGGAGIVRSGADQLLGVRLASEFSNRNRPSSLPPLEIIECPIGREKSSVKDAVQNLRDKKGCQGLLGILPVPLSIEAARWAEKKDILYLAGNNNPKVWDGRRNVFHIGVPSQMTSAGAATYISRKKQASRVWLLHAAREFQRRAAAYLAEALKGFQCEVKSTVIEDVSTVNAKFWEQIFQRKIDVLCLLDSNVERIAQLLKDARSLGRLPPVLASRGLLCADFASLAGEASEGVEFVDLYLRNERSANEEEALTGNLRNTDSGLVTTASHGFGWDCLRLLAQALRWGGPEIEGQVGYLENLKGYSGATGLLSFQPEDHNGRSPHPPTTIACLSGGRFQVVDTLGR